MEISAINRNINLSTSKQKSKTERQRFFENISKSRANSVLLMSKGREEQDGKFRYAQTITSLLAIGSAAGAVAENSHIGSIFKERFNLREGGAVLTKQEGAIVAKKLKLRKGFTLGAIIFGACAIAAGVANYISAQKTADKRGFSSVKSSLKPKNSEEIIKNIETTYDNHVKQ